MSAGAPDLRTAAIVAVGSELLGTTRLDTNSLYLTEHLNRAGIDVVCKAVVGDNRDDCAQVIRSFAERADLLVTCGGLGPTDDDVTREVVSAVFDRPLAEDPDLTARLRARYAARGYPGSMPENNRRQAMVPRGAIVIPNANGSAPGLWLDVERHVVVLLPGPPRELKPMFAALLDERIRPRTDGASIARVASEADGADRIAGGRDAAAALPASGAPVSRRSRRRFWRRSGRSSCTCRCAIDPRPRRGRCCRPRRRRSRRCWAPTSSASPARAWRKWSASCWRRAA